MKPENVLLVETPSGQPLVKLLDFGLSKSVDSELGSAAKTFVGTPCYLAPEVELVRKNGEVSYGV